MSAAQYPLSVSSVTASSPTIIYNQAYNMVVDGSSTCAVATAWSKPILTGDTQVPAISLAQALFGTNAAYTCAAVASQSLATMIANAHANIDSLIIGGKINFLIYQADYQGESSSTLISEYSTYGLARKANGWSGSNKVVAIGMLPSVGIPLNTYSAVNASLLANWTSFADYFFDVANNVFFSATNAFADPTVFLSDETTLSKNGNMAYADGAIFAAGRALGLL